MSLKNYLSNFDPRAGIVVSTDPKFIFMRPARIGGTSLLRYVLQEVLPDILIFKDRPAQWLEWLDEITDTLLEEYFIFSIVRNPWDRMLSLACYFEMSLEDLLLARHENHKVMGHSKPLVNYTHIGGKPFVDYTCRFETFEQDVTQALDLLGVSSPDVLPHVSKTEHAHYSKYYTEKTRLEIEKIYKQDILLFGYTYDS